MRKLGFILPLVIAAVVAFGAEPEKKAPEAAKPAEVKEPAKQAEAPAKVEEAKAPEKQPEAPAKAEAPAAKVEDAPISTPIPWFVPEKAEELESGMEFKVPAEGIRTKANMNAGEARSVLLKENAGGTWVVSAVNAANAEMDKKISSNMSNFAGNALGGLAGLGGNLGNMGDLLGKFLGGGNTPK